MPMVSMTTHWAMLLIQSQHQMETRVPSIGKQPQAGKLGLEICVILRIFNEETKWCLNFLGFLCTHLKEKYISISIDLEFLLGLCG